MTHPPRDRQADQDRPARVPLTMADTATKLDRVNAGSVLITGSHGAPYAARLALAAGVRAAIFNDAGVGLDGAGTAGVMQLDAYGLAAAAVDAWSARIGDASDMLARGRLSTVNRHAAGCGCRVGMTTVEAADLLRHAPPPSGIGRPISEARHQIRPASPGLPSIWALDSASLVVPGDAGAMLVIGSHGGLPGRDPAMALTIDAALAAFNDAGVGIDSAGLGRLPVLERRGIAAVTVTVAASTARIGDGLSSWAGGRISAANDPAARRGAVVGGSLREFFETFIK